MARIVDVLEKNIQTVRMFVKIGKMPLSVLNEYDIYLFYKSIDYEQRQMKKYEIVSRRFKVHIDTVRRAIINMERTARV